jgi:hypothetical protein
MNVFLCHNISSVFHCNESLGILLQEIRHPSHQPIEGNVAGGLRHLLEELLGCSYKRVRSFLWNYLPFGKKAHRARVANGALPISRGVKMYTNQLIAVDDREGVLGEVEQWEGLMRDPLERANNVASWRQFELCVTAFRYLDWFFATPPYKIPIAVGHRDQPTFLADPARILFVVDPNIKRR